MSPFLTASRPAATVAMVGAGQLARMTHQAAIDLDVRVRVLATGPEDPAVVAGASAWFGIPERLDDLRDLAAGCDVLTLDHEQVPIPHLQALVDEGVLVRPGPAAALMAGDKLHARRTLAAAGVPGPEFADVTGEEDVVRFAAAHGWPVVMKRRSGGYDGRGVHAARDAEAVRTLLADAPDGWLVEQQVAIDSEVAVLVARRPGGESEVYPVVATLQQDGICHELVMPAPLPAAVLARAREIGADVAALADAVGIVAIELFVTAGGEVLVNELALRPHNSGHATIEGCVTSQFHNHLRAILDWPLGSTRLVAPAAATVNVLSPNVQSANPGRLAAALAVPEARVHLYAKSDRPGRKVGHVTATGPDPEQVLASARRATAALVAS